MTTAHQMAKDTQAGAVAEFGKSFGGEIQFHVGDYSSA